MNPWPTISLEHPHSSEFTCADMMIDCAAVCGGDPDNESTIDYVSAITLQAWEATERPTEGRAYLQADFNALTIVSCSSSIRKKEPPTDEQNKSIEELEQNMLKRKAQLNEIEQTLPKQNGLYLKVSCVIMGRVIQRGGVLIIDFLETVTTTLSLS